jgi:hypothetical protein
VTVTEGVAWQGHGCSVWQVLWGRRMAYFCGRRFWSTAESPLCYCFRPAHRERAQRDRVRLEGEQIRITHRARTGNPRFRPNCQECWPGVQRPVPATVRVVAQVRAALLHQQSVGRTGAPAPRLPAAGSAPKKSPVHSHRSAHSDRRVHLERPPDSRVITRRIGQSVAITGLHYWRFWMSTILRFFGRTG